MFLTLIIRVNYIKYDVYLHIILWCRRVEGSIWEATTYEFFVFFVVLGNWSLWQHLNITTSCGRGEVDRSKYGNMIFGRGSKRSLVGTHCRYKKFILLPPLALVYTLHLGIYSILVLWIKQNYVVDRQIVSIKSRNGRTSVWQQTVNRMFSEGCGRLPIFVVDTLKEETHNDYCIYIYIYILYANFHDAIIFAHITGASYKRFSAVHRK